MLPKMKRTVCQTTVGEKIWLCKQILSTFFPGFSLDIRKFETSSCTTTNFRVRHVPKHKQTIFQMQMFPCPLMVYTDLETDEIVTLPHIYRLSRGLNADTAVVFVQNTINSPLYPELYFSGIDMKKIEKYLKEEKERPPKHRSVTRFTKSHLDETLNAYLEGRRILNRK